MSELRDEVLSMMSYAQEWGPSSYKEHMAEMGQLLDAYRDEVLREAADRAYEVTTAAGYEALAEEIHSQIFHMTND